jgi:hypothetical protein
VGGCRGVNAAARALVLLFGCVAMCAVGQTLPNAPSTIVANSATVTGIVMDVGGTPVADAQVVLTGPSGLVRKTVADADGAFLIDALPAGEMMVTVAAEGLTGASAKVTVAAGETKSVPDFSLKVATANFQVDAISQVELADLQIKQEETQRLLGIMPNFYVSYDPNAVAMNTKQKFKLAGRTIIDPVTLVTTGMSAGVQQAQNTFAGYGQGTSGYAKRYAANYANFAIGTVLGGAVFPSMFHQDPRYFYKGTGSVWSRTLYAMSTAVRCKGDNGKWQWSYSGILGDFSAGAISNLYYPESDRDGARLTLENGGIAVISDAFNNVVQEFLLKHFTPKQKTP